MVHRPIQQRTPLFAYCLRNVTEAAALAAYDWVGRGDKNAPTARRWRRCARN